MADVKERLMKLAELDAKIERLQQQLETYRESRAFLKAQYRHEDGLDGPVCIDHIDHIDGDLLTDWTRSY